MKKLKDILEPYTIHISIGLISIIVKVLDNLIDERNELLDFLDPILNISGLVACCILCHALFIRIFQNPVLLHGLILLSANLGAVSLDFLWDFFLFNDEIFFGGTSFFLDYAEDSRITITYWGFVCLIDHLYRRRLQATSKIAADKASMNPTGFIKDIPKQWNLHIDLIEAQENYIKVHHGADNVTLLYRFKDAVHELGDQVGLQVHRSYWINKSAIKSFSKKQGRGVILTPTDHQVPVSRTYLKTVEDYLKTL